MCRYLTENALEGFRIVHRGYGFLWVQAVSLSLYAPSCLEVVFSETQLPLLRVLGIAKHEKGGTILLHPGS